MDENFTFYAQTTMSSPNDLNTSLSHTFPVVTNHYCNLEDFSKTYREMHGYFSVLVCCFGSIANILNICVLSMREMRWPTNFILTGLAFADLLVMLDYIPFAIHVYFDPDSRLTANYFTYSWAIYIFFHALFAQVCHFISCCLTLMLAIWRYIAITHPQNNKIWCNAYKTKLAIVLTYILCPVMCFPIYMSLKIDAKSRPIFNNGSLIPERIFNSTDLNITSFSNETIYVVSYSAYEVISFLVYGVVLKLVPCIILAVLSKQLISALIAAQKRRYNLLANKGVPLENMNGKLPAANQRLIEKEQQTDRTTRMLLAVLLLFLLTEFPQAISGLLSAIIGQQFERECHRPLGDLFDIFALTNCAINFILYCTMSRQFREAFGKLFSETVLDRLFKKVCKPDETSEAIATVTNV